MSVFNDNDIEINSKLKLTESFLTDYCRFQGWSDNDSDYELKIIDDIILIASDKQVFIETSNIPDYIKISSTKSVTIYMNTDKLNLDSILSGCPLLQISCPNPEIYNYEIFSNNPILISQLSLNGFMNGVSLDIHDMSYIGKLMCYRSRLDKYNKKFTNLELDKQSALFMVGDLLHEKYKDLEFNVSLLDW